MEQSSDIFEHLSKLSEVVHTSESHLFRMDTLVWQTPWLLRVSKCKMSGQKYDKFAKPKPVAPPVEEEEEYDEFQTRWFNHLK
jgi:hypothetical protein